MSKNKAIKSNDITITVVCLVESESFRTLTDDATIGLVYCTR